MASARKKLDEKNLKILRELATLPANKYCFDCHQRGPTYVNITIGSFVCTKCSGILRGLTPPHRVKSISMATFTQEEVDFIKNKGNQYCQNVWLGLCENEPATKDDLQIKDFMIDKYEKKRYYVEPSVAAERLTTSNGTSSQSPSSTPITLPTPPNKTNINTNETKKSVCVNGGGVAQKFVDPFEPSSQNQPSFANFDNNPIFSSTSAVPGTGALLPPLSGNSVVCQPAAPSEDRYAALKDLDSLMKSQNSPAEKPLEAPKDPWGSNSNGNTNGFWGASTIGPLESSKGFNPFSSDSWGPNISSNTNVGNNPFKDLKHADWGGSNGLTTSQSFGAFQWTSNPFAVGANGGGSVTGTGYQPSNPFL